MDSRSKDPRIESMYRGDLAWALVALLVLWLTIVFVFFEVLASSASTGVVIALVVFGALVLLFNSASIVALLRHYSSDKAHLYGLDLHYLDAMRGQKR